jgi:hypothetical protein
MTINHLRKNKKTRKLQQVLIIHRRVQNKFSSHSEITEIFDLDPDDLFDHIAMQILVN